MEDTNYVPSASLSPTSYQTVPTPLLIDLTRPDPKTGQPSLEIGDIAIYALIKVHARRDSNCYVSIKKLADESGWSEATVDRSLRRLSAAGHIQRKEENYTGKIRLLTDVENWKVIKRLPLAKRKGSLREFLATPSTATSTPNTSPESIAVGDGSAEQSQMVPHEEIL